jgi:hypothetical protein
MKTIFLVCLSLTSTHLLPSCRLLPHHMLRPVPFGILFYCDGSTVIELTLAFFEIATFIPGLLSFD